MLLLGFNYIRKNRRKYELNLFIYIFWEEKKTQNYIDEDNASGNHMFILHK